MNNKKLVIWIPLAALLCNGLGYLIVSTIRSSSKAPATVSPATPAAALSAEGRTDDLAKEEMGRARRAAGLAALEAGDYGKALINFTEARTLLGERARVDELLHVTEDLRTRSKAPPAEYGAPSLPPAPVARFTPPPVFRAPVRAPVVARPPAADPVAADPRPSAPVSASGLLLVTTTPRGLLVQVDGSPLDLTPMRVSVKAGTHRVTLLDGDRRLYETSVEVNEGSPTTVLRDLSAEMAQEPRSGVIAAVAKDEAPRPSTATAPPASDPVGPQAPRPVLAADPGGLDITSPGLYGMVWVNGRPQGYPPVRARDLPPGPTKVEVRVNGVEKRSTTVVVQPGTTTAIKLK